jgi:hypothetical protein
MFPRPLPAKMGRDTDRLQLAVLGQMSEAPIYIEAFNHVAIGVQGASRAWSVSLATRV